MIENNDLKIVFSEQFSTYIIKKVRKNFSINLFFNKILKMHDIQNFIMKNDINDLDEQIKKTIINETQTSIILKPSERFQRFIELHNFLYEIRERIKLKLGIKESTFILEKQKRIISPDIKAFQYMPGHNVDIIDNPNKYDLIFD